MSRSLMHRVDPYRKPRALAVTTATRLGAPTNTPAAIVDTLNHSQPVVARRT